MRITLIFTFFILISFQNKAQQLSDTLKKVLLEGITIEATRTELDIKRLPGIQDNFIYSGKKNEWIDLSRKDFSVSEKYGRQIFAKIPGVFVYDMDGTGNQLNVSTRGLDPHRGWEFNIRKDGIMTNSDMYGYPASHYNVPMEAIDHIELVRGTGSLQYGAQFGGMINYVTKQPKKEDTFGFESINTAGSYGLLSSFNMFSGNYSKWTYSGWFVKKSLDGYRKSGDSKYNAEGISLKYQASENLSIKLEWTHSNYTIHLAGALTDAQFEEDPRQATRNRNYYNPNIHIPSLRLEWKLSKNTHLSFTNAYLFGQRNSVLFDKPTNIKDTINAQTLQYNNRQVDIDNFNSFTSEARLLQHYKIGKTHSNLATGFQLIRNDLNRRQLGKGSTGSDFDLSLVTPGWGRDLHFKTNNLALFVENKWNPLTDFSISAGMRYETGQSDLSGKINYYPDDQLPNQIKHSFPLFGLNAEYKFNEYNNIYAGWSQAYRPVILKDIIPGSLYEISDKNLKDAHGYNIEMGFRGNWKFLKWDLSAFLIEYDNRLGTIAQKDSAGNLIIFRTNIGNSETKGIECFVQTDFYPGKKLAISIFSSTSYMDARYKKASLRNGNENVDLSGNKVESVPEWISRNGLNVKYSKWSTSILGSFTSSTFADAINTVKPTANAASGLVPSYFLLDLNVSYYFNDQIRLQLNCNNVLDKDYFTKRPQFYPGPGIWPSDGRTLSATIAIKL
ncbi:MAG: TonB-dependent receptor [Saprospiraceae bacterium]|nr:TonB-dependent receptor [Saprospiraceae bacterium]